jgi:hypothetical protein
MNDFKENQKLQKTLHQIITGRKIFAVGDRYFACRFPDHFEVELGQMMYERSLREAVESDLPLRADLEKQLYDRGVLTQEQDDRLKELQDQIGGQIAALSKMVSEKRIQDTQENIDRLRTEQNDILIDRYRYLSMSAESKANEQRILFLVPYCVDDALTRHHYWPDNAVFNQERNRFLVSTVISEFMDFMNGCEEKTLRHMARGAGGAGVDWRTRWRASVKSSTPPFHGPVSDWDINKVRLCYWSAFYDSVWEHPERPDERTIENDDLLDHWVKKQADENEQRARNNSKGVNKSALDHDEMIIFGDEEGGEDDTEEYYEEVDEDDGGV